MGKNKKSEVSSESSDYESSESSEYFPEEASDPLLKENIDALMKQLKDVMIEHEKKKLVKSRNPILVSLNKYIKVLEQTRPEEHREYFLKVYKRYRIAILANKNDRWLKRNSVKIVYGDSKIRIMLSSIYNIACNLADAEEDRLDGLPDDAYEDCLNLIRKDVILLHLYRVFKEFAPEDDQEKLTRVVAYYEDLVGLEVSKPTKTAADAPKNPMGAIGDLLNNLVSGFNKTAEENNISADEIPPIGKVLNDAMNNDAIKNVFQDLMTKLSDGSLGGEGGNPLEEIMKGVSKTITSPEFAETVGNTMASVTEKTEGPRGPAFLPQTTPKTSPNGPSSSTLRLEPKALTSPCAVEDEGPALPNISEFPDLPAP